MDAIVLTTHGKVHGLEHEGLLQFRGIAYARPPVAALRFKAPLAPESWQGVRDAQHFPPAAIQEVSPMNPVGKTSEDCLYLNLWTPAADRKKRPVMVWIHGGSFVSGSASMPQYQCAQLVKRGDVVALTLNYRLGILGFGHLKEYYGDRVDSNLGLRDQIAALEWVRDNIAEFGGDPENITLFGESAGAICIAALLTSPRIKGLVKNAIIQSGSPDYVLTSAEAERLRTLYWPLLELSHDQALWTLPAENFLKAQHVALKQCVQRGEHVHPMPLYGMTLIPVVGDDVLPHSPLDCFKTSKIDANILLGTMSQEWNFFLKVPQGVKGSFVDRYKDLDLEGLQKLFERSLPGSGEDALRTYYHDQRLFTDTDTHFSHKLLDLYGDFESDKAFGMPSLRIAEQQSAFGGSVYQYLCTWNQGSFGAAHAADIPLVFGEVDSGFGRLFTGGGQGAREMSEKIQDAWLAFAHCGNPSTEALGEWPSYSAQRPLTMELGARCRVFEKAQDAIKLFWAQRL